MIGLDTSVLLRYVLNDDPIQSPKAREVLRSLTTQDPGWIGIGTLFEMVWVLTKSKNMRREAVSKTLTEFLLLDSIVVEQDSIVELALLRFNATKADLADCVIAASANAAGCGKTLTFDRVAARDAGMELVPA